MEQVARLRIQRSERLVHQQDVRLGGQGARQSDPLPHAARKLVRVAVAELGKMHQPQVVLDLLFALRLWNVLHLHSELNVLRDR